MSKSHNLVVPSAYLSVFERVIEVDPPQLKTRKQIDEALENCDLLNVQLTDTIDLIAGAVSSEETDRLHVANALNLIAGVARMNTDILLCIADKLSEDRK